MTCAVKQLCSREEGAKCACVVHASGYLASTTADIVAPSQVESINQAYSVICSLYESQYVVTAISDKTVLHLPDIRMDNASLVVTETVCAVDVLSNSTVAFP